MPFSKIRHFGFLSFPCTASYYQPFRFFNCSILHPKLHGSQVEPKLSQKSRQKPADPKTVKDALDYCLEIVKTRDYDNYVATLLMQKPVQCRALAIFALNAEVAVIRHKIKRNSGVTGIYQLQFWKDALNLIYGNQPGPAPRQPVVTALRTFAKSADLELLQNLVAARTETLGDRPFPNIDALEKNSDAIHGSLIKLIAQALDPEGLASRRSNCTEAASAMGKALGIVNLLRATIPLLKEDVILLPADLMAIHGLNENDIFRNSKPDAFRAMSKEMCEISKHHLKTSRSYCHSLEKPLRTAFLSSGAKLDHLLGIFEKSGYNIQDSRLQKYYPLLTWQLWWRNFRNVY
uniref:15-cis-phytoene synthase n=2 Tax=Acrobeloides nanus TaxID=290746 RepID=A0A914CBI2_9BILA